MLYHTDLSFRVFHRVTWHCISLSGTSTVPFSYLVPNICTYTAFLFHAACCTHETYPNQRTLRQARIIAVLFTFHGFSSSTAVGVCSSATVPAIRGVHSNSGAGRIRGAIRRAPCFYRTYAAHGWPVLLPCARLRLSFPPLNHPRLSACATSSFFSHLCMGALLHILSDPSCAPMNITQ